MALETNILKTVKTFVGLLEDDEAFDNDVLVSINDAFSTLNQLGLLPYMIEAGTTWAGLGLDPMVLAKVRAYVPMKVRMMVDPPTLSFLIDMKNKQLEEAEWRIRCLLEEEVA